MSTDVLTTDRSRSTEAEHTLAAVHELAPVIAARAGEVENARRVPPDLVDQLMDAGCFRLVLPTSHGGAGADLPFAMQVFETLARADASVGWTVMIGAGSWIEHACLPRAGFDSLYAEGPDAITAGVFNPTGSAVATDTGFQVTGRWAFASGCEHARWLFGNCIEVVDGEPQLRTAVFEPDQVHIEDTWRVAGLRGTGSHHFTAEVEVAAERTCRTMQDEPCLDEPVVRIPPPALYALAIASVAIGTAQGALDEILAMATDKVPLLAPAPLAANPHFQFELAGADAELRAARALLCEDARDAWASARAAQEFTPEQRARIRASAVFAVARAVAVVETAYHAGGGSALYADSPLQRRLRDVHAITQHFLVKPDTLTTAGAVLAGQDADLTVF
jgi:alkylation response protein AidB-like acyl-CoA dehydrogenase